jgi:ribonuclease D
VTAAPAQFLATASELTALVKDIRAAGRLALDTEFVWERTYRPELGVIQIATDRTVAVIDTVAIEDLSALFPVLQDPKIPVVLHGGGQDLEIMAVLMGTPMRGVVDTQVEAAFLGYGLQVGLSVLLERVLKVRIRKDQTYTDWLRRPLKPEQVVYAEQDVLHLLPMHDKLRADLERRERLAWVEEELRDLEDPERWAPLPDADRFRTVKSWQRHDGRELAVLRAIAAWRERAARRANIRPNFICNDVVLTTIASRPVDSIDELRQVRGLSSGTVDRHGKALLAAIREGVECPKEKWPEPPPRVRHHAPPSGLIALLRASVQAVADREEIAPEVIASARDIEGLVEIATAKGREAPSPDENRLLHGWRHRLTGETLLRISRGELRIRFDPVKREVVTEPHDVGAKAAAE